MSSERFEYSDQQSGAQMNEALDRMLSEGLTLPSFGRVTPQQQQVLPLNVYETGEDLIVVAPVPGLRTEDITIAVTDEILTIQCECRGPEQETKNYHRHEWHYGPYYRSLRLPVVVDAVKANASFSNGLLVISLPKAEEMRSSRIMLRRVGQNQGECAGHSAAEFMPGGHTHRKEAIAD